MFEVVNHLVELNVNVFVVDHKVFNFIIPFVSHIVVLHVMYLLRYVL